MTITKRKGERIGTGRNNHISTSSEEMAGGRKESHDGGSRAEHEPLAVARKFGINPNRLFRCRKLINEGARCAVGADESVVPVSEVKKFQAKARELELLLGRKTRRWRSSRTQSV